MLFTGVHSHSHTHTHTHTFLFLSSLFLYYLSDYGSSRYLWTIFLIIVSSLCNVIYWIIFYLLLWSRNTLRYNDSLSRSIFYLLLLVLLVFFISFHPYTLISFVDSFCNSISYSLLVRFLLWFVVVAVNKRFVVFDRSRLQFYSQFANWNSVGVFCCGFL